MSLIFLHFKYYTFAIIVPEIVSVIIWLLILKCCFNIENKWYENALESIFIGWLTMTNLENIKSASFARLVSSMVTLTVKTLCLEFSVLNDEKVIWCSTLQIILHATVAIGWFSLVLDILTGLCKKEKFLDGCIILEGVKGCECNCCEGGCSFLF